VNAVCSSGLRVATEAATIVRAGGLERGTNERLALVVAACRSTPAAEPAESRPRPAAAVTDASPSSRRSLRVIMDHRAPPDERDGPGRPLTSRRLCLEAARTRESCTLSLAARKSGATKPGIGASSTTSKTGTCAASLQTTSPPRACRCQEIPPGSGVPTAGMIEGSSPSRSIVRNTRLPRTKRGQVPQERPVRGRGFLRKDGLHAAALATERLLARRDVSDADLEDRTDVEDPAGRTGMAERRSSYSSRRSAWASTWTHTRSSLPVTRARARASRGNRVLPAENHQHLRPRLAGQNTGDGLLDRLPPSHPASGGRGPADSSCARRIRRPAHAELVVEELHLPRGGDNRGGAVARPAPYDVVDS